MGKTCFQKSVLIIDEDDFKKQRRAFSEISRLIEEARNFVAVSVNAGLTKLYWNIGARINQETLSDNRAEYGKRIVAFLAKQLTDEYGASFSEKNLRRIIQFADVFPNEEIVVSLLRQLSWSHLDNFSGRRAGFHPIRIKLTSKIILSKRHEGG